MRFLYLLFLIIAGCQTSSSINDEKEIRNLLDSIIAADNRSDIHTVLSCYTDDAVLMPANKPSIKGISAIEENYTSIFENSALHIESHIEEINIAGTWAAITGFNTGKVFIRKDSSSVSVNDKFILLAEKQNNSWKIKKLIWNKNQ
jgi:uncharacterized protein (TIGR02246 family)